jgi:type I restriction enzyme, S subunit
MAWKNVQLGQYISVQSGYAFRSRDYRDKGHFLVRIGNVQDGQLNLDKPKFVSLDDKTRRFELRAGDFLMSLTGNIGRVAKVEYGHLPAALNQRVARINVADERVLSSDFLYRFLSSQSFRDEFAAAGHGAAQQNISPKEIANVEIPLAPFPEQQRIVAILDEAFEGIDAAIANTRKNLANARELFESHLNSAFAHISSGWPDRELGELCERITKGSSPKWQGISYVDEPGIMFITSENVGQNQLIMKKVKYVEEAFNQKDKKSILQYGDVLTNIVGASIGRTAVFDMHKQANINQAVCLIRPIEEMLSNRYLALLLNSPYFKKILHDNEIDNARANLSLGFFRSLAIPVPTMGVQLELVGQLKLFEEKTQRLEAIYQQKIDALVELKQSILQKAFSGELTQQEAAA